MANPMIKFLRGSQENFNKIGTYAEGVFYLTDDTNRLYIGDKNGKAALLNSAINVYDKVASLPATPPNSEKDNDSFAYCAEENILAIYKYDAVKQNGAWIQINSDTQNVSVAHNVTAVETDEIITSATVGTTVKDRRELSDSFSIAKGSNVNLAVSGKEITISAVDEKATKAGHYVPVADTTSNSTDKTVSGTGFVTGVKVDKNGHVVGVNTTEQTITKVTSAKLDAGAVSNNTTTISMEVSDNQGGTGSDTMSIKGGNAVTLSVANDTITISSTDESVTGVDKHYKATTGTDENLTKQFAIGVKKDAAGHVINVNGSNSSEATEVSSVQNGTNGAIMTVNAKNIFGDDKSDTQGFIGGGDNVITVDASGNIVITGTDQSVTDVAHHYTPSGNGTAESAGSKKFATGVMKDAAGHIISVTGAASAEETAVSAAATANTSNSVTLTVNAKNIFGDDKSDTQEIIGGGATTVSIDNGKIKISSTDNDSKVTSAANHYTPTTADNATKSASSAATATAAKAQTPVITGIETDGKGHITGVVSAKISDTHNTIKSVALTANNGVLGTSVEMNDGDSQSDTIALTVKYGKDAEGTRYGTSAPLTAAGTGDSAAESGKWELDVYTTAQVDAKIANAVGANGAVQIVGTVDATHDLPSGTSVKAGDTYIVTASKTSGFGPTKQKATAGDMFIASQDNTGSTGFTWYYIPAGNEVITMADSGNNGFKFVEGNSDVTVGTVNFAKYNEGATDFQVVAEVETTSNTSNVSFNMYWGSF